jgi:Cu(I)/Ag(I) efflux system membrane protein CusA/SilA
VAEQFGLRLLVSVLMLIFIKGKLRPESENPVSRISQAVYLPA